MVLHVKDEETDELVRTLARSRGIGITTAIKEAVREAIALDASRSVGEDKRSLDERLKPLLARLDTLPRKNLRTDKEFFDDAWGE
jgi:antitoxin VapB